MATDTGSHGSDLVDRLVGRRCQYCEDGTLAAGEYKDNDGVVCENCGTPALQLF